MESLYLSHIETPVGTLVVAATETFIYMLEYADEKRINKHKKTFEEQFKLVNGKPNLVSQLENELESYFRGTLSQFKVPIQFTGTDFQQSVWEAILHIPYGTTRSYSDQSIFMNQPLAIRAIANANGQNKLAILVPCHRIIGANGTMTGYSGGTMNKRYLLELEQGIQQKSLFN